MKKAKSLLVLSFLMVCILLGGCSRPNTIKRSILNDDFNNYSRALVISRGFTFNKGTQKDRNVSLTVKQKQQVDKLERHVKKNQQRLRHSTMLNDYPRNLIAYGDAVVRYLDLSKKTSVKNTELISSYHKAAKKGLVIVNYNLNGRPTNIFRAVIAADYDDGHSLIPSRGQTVKINAKNNGLRKQRVNQKVVQITLWGSALLALLIIVIVIAQPSKQADTMDALTENGNRTLFDQAKARGKKLLLQRLTIIGFILLCCLLATINYYVRN